MFTRSKRNLYHNTSEEEVEQLMLEEDSGSDEECGSEDEIFDTHYQPDEIEREVGQYIDDALRAINDFSSDALLNAAGNLSIDSNELNLPSANSTTNQVAAYEVLDEISLSSDENQSNEVFEEIESNEVYDEPESNEVYEEVEVEVEKPGPSNRKKHGQYGRTLKPPKRPRSPLPEIEEGGPEVQSNDGGFNGNDCKNRSHFYLFQ